MKVQVNSAISWSAIDIVIRQIFNLLVIVVLARILSPSDFGLLAMVAIFMAVASILGGAGLSQALIQREKSSLEEESAIFFFNIVIGLFIAGTLCVSAEWIAIFLGQPILKDIIMVLSLNVVINSFGVVHLATLNKALNFKVVAQAGITASIVSGLMAILLAKEGWGVWSLVVQALLASIINVLLLWFLHSWKPCLRFRVGAIRSYLRYGGYITLEGLVYVIYQNVYAMLIGRNYTASQAGLYARSYDLVQVPIVLLTNIVSRVAFPVFSQVKDDKSSVRQGLRKSLVSVMFITLPITVLMGIEAEAIIQVVLGSQWGEAAPILMVLSIAAALMPIQMLNVTLLRALGYVRKNFYLMLAKFFIAIGLLFVALPYGVKAIAISFVISHVFNLFINTFYSYKYLDYGIFKQVKDLIPYIIASFIMAVVVTVIQHQIDLPSWAEVIVLSVVGGSIYYAICWVAKLEGPRYFMKLIGRL